MNCLPCDLKGQFIWSQNHHYRCCCQNGHQKPSAMGSRLARQLQRPQVQVYVYHYQTETTHDHTLLPLAGAYWFQSLLPMLLWSHHCLCMGDRCSCISLVTHTHEFTSPENCIKDMIRLLKISNDPNLLPTKFCPPRTSKIMEWANSWIHGHFPKWGYN